MGENRGELNLRYFVIPSEMTPTYIYIIIIGNSKIIYTYICIQSEVSNEAKKPHVGWDIFTILLRAFIAIVGSRFVAKTRKSWDMSPIQ